MARRRAGRRLGRLLAIIAVTWLMFGAALAGMQRHFLYFPDARRPVAPAGVETLSLHTQDGLDLLAWYAPPRDAAQPVVLYLHGNAGNIGDRAGRLAAMRAMGWGVMLLEWRGYAGNPGTPSEAGLLADARAAHAALRARGAPAGRIIAWGESLGTGIAVPLALEQPVGAVVLESPYASMVAMGQHFFPYLPVGWLLQDRFDTLGRIGKLAVPVAVLVGDADQLVPMAQSRAVYEAAPEPRLWWQARGVGHNEVLEAGGLTAAAAFLRAQGLR